jgi:hypothetical protein
MQTLRIRDVFMKMPNKGGRPPPPAKNRERQTREERKAFLWKGKQDHKLSNSENDLDCIHNHSTLQTDGRDQQTEIDFACDPHRKGEERKPRFFERDFPFCLPDRLRMGVKFFPPSRL